MPWNKIIHEEQFVKKDTREHQQRFVTERLEHIKLQQ